MVQETAATETTGSLAPSILDRRPSSLRGNNKHSYFTVALGKEHLLPSLDTVIHGYIISKPLSFSNGTLHELTHIQLNGTLCELGRKERVVPCKAAAAIAADGRSCPQFGGKLGLSIASSRTKSEEER